MRPHGDQFSASTRPGRAKESKKDTQSSDHVEGRVPDDLPQGIAVVPDLHFMLKMLQIAVFQQGPNIAVLRSKAIPEGPESDHSGALFGSVGSS